MVRIKQKILILQNVNSNIQVHNFEMYNHSLNVKGLDKLVPFLEKNLSRKYEIV